MPTIRARGALALRRAAAVLPAVALAAGLAACDNFSGFNDTPTPVVISVAGVWQGTATTTSCTPAPAPSEDWCAVLAAAGDFPFTLVLLQQEDRLDGGLDFAGQFVRIGGLVTESDIIRLAGSAPSNVNPGAFDLIVRSWSTEILGRGAVGSRMSGTWVTEASIQDEEGTARAQHAILAATRTQ